MFSYSTFQDMARKHSFTALLICCLVVSAALSYDPFHRPDGKRTVAGLFRRVIFSFIVDATYLANQATPQFGSEDKRGEG